MKRYYISGLFFLLCLLARAVGARDSGDTAVFRLGIWADVQYADSPSKGMRDFRKSMAKLLECVEALNEKEVDLMINLGDLTDCSPIDVDTLLLVLNRSCKKVYHVLGNHDFMKIKDVYPLLKKLEMLDLYYVVELKEWKLVFLDTNDIAKYSLFRGGNREEEYYAMIEAIREENRKNEYSWNGGVGKHQMEWLKIELKKSMQKGQKVLVFGHHPIYPSSPNNCLNDNELLQVLSLHSCVKAYISGHHHSGHYGCYKGMHCITIEGMVESGDKNAFIVLSAFPDELILKGFGNASSYFLHLR